MNLTVCGTRQCVSLFLSYEYMSGDFSPMGTVIPDVHLVRHFPEAQALVDGDWTWVFLISQNTGFPIPNALLIDLLK